MIAEKNSMGKFLFFFCPQIVSRVSIEIDLELHFTPQILTD